MTQRSNASRKQRASSLKWVPIALMQVSPKAQREFRVSHAERFAADFDLEALGFPVVNHRDGRYYIVDGQHRIEALKMIGYGDQQIQCECYDGLSEAEEADLFLRRDDRKAIGALDKYRIGLTAERDEETNIDRIVQAEGLRVSGSGDGIKAVGTLRKVYHRCGEDGFGRTLRIVRDAYGDAGLEGPVIDGIGHVCARYNGQLDDARAVSRLSAAHGGVSGLLAKANVLRRQTGNQQAHCVAAAAVEIINGGRGGNKLPTWWKS